MLASTIPPNDCTSARRKGLVASARIDPSPHQTINGTVEALPTGPVRDPAGKAIARFNSIWRQEAEILRHEHPNEYLGHTQRHSERGADGYDAENHTSQTVNLSAANDSTYRHSGARYAGK